MPNRIPLSKDEWLLCLEVYLRHRGQPLPNKDSAEIRELSDSMRRIRAALAGKPSKHFRLPHGVLRRVLEIRHLDEGHKRVHEIPKRAHDVWETWGKASLATVSQIAEAIKKCVDAKEVQEATKIHVEYNYHAFESQILTRIHSVRERDRRIVELKKERFKDENGGKLYCEACSFDFAQTYPRHGEGFIECHHVKPLSKLLPGEKTTLDDLALLCSNCHRMVHYRHPWLDMSGLNQVLSYSDNRT